jgi:hypothetical protein
MHSTLFLKTFNPSLAKRMAKNPKTFLSWHQLALTTIGVKLEKQNPANFLIPNEKITPEAIKTLKTRLGAVLMNKSSSVVLSMSPQQYFDFKKCSLEELVFFHGNQFLTGAPFFPGGIPTFIPFQWGNLFGVAKSSVLASEKSVKGNILIYFEDMRERELSRCVEDYLLNISKDDIAAEQKPHSYQIY